MSHEKTTPLLDHAAACEYEDDDDDDNDNDAVIRPMVEQRLHQEDHIYAAAAEDGRGTDMRLSSPQTCRICRGHESSTYTRTTIVVDTNYENIRLDDHDGSS